MFVGGHHLRDLTFRALMGGIALLALTAAAVPGGWQEKPVAEVLPGDVPWASFNSREDGVRFSELADINADNVKDLSEVCRVRVSGPGAFSSGPVVVDGVLYLTALNGTIAMNPTNCDIKWKSVYTPTSHEYLAGNRGAAVAEGLVVRGTADGHLVAYDAQSGKERWVSAVGDSSKAEFVSSVPLIWRGLVLVGLAGGDWGIRGRMMAFDLKTGARKWNFNIIPGPGEPGNETWKGDTWQHGGGGTWTAYTLDPATGELFVPVANPSPDFNGKARPGSNLFTSSVLVLDALTGKYLWHYQTEANDSWDRGVTAAPVLFSLANGKSVVSVATMAGYLYTIDRKTHKLLYKVPTTTIVAYNVPTSPEGVRFCPGLFGGTEWNGPGYDPHLRTLVVGSVDWCGTFKRADEAYQTGELYLGGTAKQEDASSGWITSFDAATGKKQWQFHAPAPVVSGITPTAGGVTFVGDLGGNLYAFKTSDGTILKTIDTGGAIAGGVITYKALGEQYLAVTSGNISRATWPKATGVPSIVLYKVKGASDKPAGALPGKGDDLRISLGRSTYQSLCAGCHGSNREGVNGPNLRAIALKYDHASLANRIKNPISLMPKLYPSAINEDGVENVSAYLLSESRK